MGHQPGQQPRIGLDLISMDKWSIYKHINRWWASHPEQLRKFRTWQEAFDHAFTEATRELSDR